jgi:hypothetical protein
VSAIEDFEYPYSWTHEDTRTCDALVRFGYMTYREPITVLGIVQAARAYERARLAEILDEQPEHIRGHLTDVLLWLDKGAPDTDDIGGV